MLSVFQLWEGNAMSFNQVTLLGRIATDLKSRHAKRETHEEPMRVVEFKLSGFRCDQLPPAPLDRSEFVR